MSAAAVITPPETVATRTDLVRVLTADDDPSTRRTWGAFVHGSGWTPIEAAGGEDALAILTGADAPRVALVDWLMPDVTGIEVCRRVRAADLAFQPYLILVTVRSATGDIVDGLDAGADDYMIKPVDAAELRARVRVGLRTLGLQERLAAHVTELEGALRHVQQLQSLLPICSYCRRIRDDGDYWQNLEEYVSRHTDVRFSHGCCPQCYEAYVRPELEACERRSVHALPDIR